jgi:hypothetical protein
MVAYQFYILMLVLGKKELIPIFYCDFGFDGGGSCLHGGFVQLQGNKNCISGTAQTSIIRTTFGVVLN